MNIFRGTIVYAAGLQKLTVRKDAYLVEEKWPEGPDRRIKKDPIRVLRRELWKK